MSKAFQRSCGSLGGILGLVGGQQPWFMTQASSSVSKVCGDGLAVDQRGDELLRGARACNMFAAGNADYVCP